jgi:hypothetical protein
MSFAGVGMLGYGKTFIQLTFKMLLSVLKGTGNLLHKILGIYYLKKLANFLSKKNVNDDLLNGF